MANSVNPNGQLLRSGSTVKIQCAAQNSITAQTAKKNVLHFAPPQFLPALTGPSYYSQQKKARTGRCQTALRAQEAASSLLKKIKNTEHPKWTLCVGRSRLDSN